MTSRSTSDAAFAGASRAGAPGQPELALLAAKLAPPALAHATVARSRLLALLTRAVERSPLTLLSGPAGSGKTVLAGSWRRAQGAARSIAWLTLDEYDDDPATFWTYVVQALGGAGVAIADLPSLVPGEPPPGALVPRLAAELAGLPRPVVLVVDNADQLTDRSITAGLDLLVRNAGSRLRMVLCARADPLLPLHRYRLTGTIAELRCDQLAFTGDETRDLLRAMGVPVTPEVARALCAETRGWAVGLRLAAAPLKQGVPPERLVTSLAHDDGSVAQYLFAEVLQNQPAGVRRLLLRTSVTAELWPDLVDRLGGRRNSRRVFAELAHANAFVEDSPGEPGGFRIHPLFREMLRAQLAYDHPGELAGLHRTCAAWYADAGRATDAVAHAIAAEDWAFVTRLLVDDLLVVRLLAHGTDPALRGLQALPAGLGGPEAAVIRAAVALAAGRLPAGADLAVASAVGAGARPTLRVSAALTCLTAGALQGGGPTGFLARVDAAERLLDALPEEDRKEHRECMAVLTGVRSAALLGTDAPDQVLMAELRVAATASATAGSRRLRCAAVAQLALLEALDGHLSRATQLAGEAEALTADEGRDELERRPAAATALAWVHLVRYALVEARDWANRAGARAQQSAGREAAVADAVLAVLHSRLLRLRHEYDAAEQTLGPHLHGPRLPRWVRERVVSEGVRLAFARGRIEEGLAVLGTATGDAGDAAALRATASLLRGRAPDGVPAAERGRSPAVAVELGVVRACGLLQEGHPSAAAEALAGALDEARPELFRWPFLDAPPQARRLLRTHPRLRAPGAWLRPATAVAARPGAGGPDAGGAVEAPRVTQELSDRELEVLRHLSEMLSTAEIAATMFISVNTVRTHIRSILRKLGVSRRNQAVRRARESGIL